MKCAGGIDEMGRLEGCTEQAVYLHPYRSCVPNAPTCERHARNYCDGREPDVAPMTSATQWQYLIIPEGWK